MKFFSPPDDSGGGTAVADPPEVHADPVSTPVEDVYNKALAEAQGKEAPEPKAKPAKKEPAKAKAEKADPAKMAAKTAEGEPKPVKADPLDTVLAEPKKAEPEPAPDPLADLDEKNPNWAKAREKISTQHGELTKRDAQIAELTKQIETGKTVKPESEQKLQALQEEVNRYKDAMVAVNIELEPEFRAKFIDGRANHIAKATEKLKAYGGNVEALEIALALPEGRRRSDAIEEALGELKDVEKARIMNIVADVEKLDDEKADVMKNAQQSWEKYQRTHEAERAAQNEKAEEYKKAVFEKVGRELPGELLILRTLPPETEGASEWNQKPAQIREKAFALLGPETTAEDTAKAAYWAAAGPELQSLLVAERTARKQLEVQLKEFEASEPQFQGRKQPKKTGKDANIEADPGDVYEAEMRRQSERE